MTFFRRLVANIAFIAIVVFLLSLAFGEKSVKIPESAVLVLSPAGVIVEQRSESLLTSELLGEDVTAETVLKDIVDALDHAGKDPRIRGVLLDLSKLQGAGFSKLQDIGTALKRFRESGKPVIAASDIFRQRNYYLAAHADRVYLNPMGGVLLTGFGIYQNYYKSALDKLQIQFHVFRVGSYKSALEPFMRDDMSDFDRSANSALLDVLWASYKNDVAAQRRIDPASIDDYVNHFPIRLAAVRGEAAQLALSFGLVDELKTTDQLRDELIELAGQDRSKRSYNQVRFDEYLKSIRSSSPKIGEGEPKVDVIVAQGVILEGSQPAGRIGGASLSALIHQAWKNDATRAIVLRIDSPGGSAFASDAIRRELELARRAGKPVVVSMGSVAASGGYWIASGADEIWAAPTTITGSIGIFSAFPTFERSLQALGISNDGVGTTRLADAFNPNRPMNRLMADAMNQFMEQGYSTFIARVAEGRNMTPEAVRMVAEGRVWAGQSALEKGLIDRLGGLEAAIVSAANRAGLETYAVDYPQQPLTRRERLLKELNEFFTRIIVRALGAVAPEQAVVMKVLAGTAFDDLLKLNDPQGLYAFCLDCGGI
ncbi:MAG: signal peptide peptidase SppA [Desulfobacterales bacterium]|nr:signal peptide peptidase SppA [Desulfobacterales bacterium]